MQLKAARRCGVIEGEARTNCTSYNSCCCLGHEYTHVHTTLHIHTWQVRKITELLLETGYELGAPAKDCNKVIAGEKASEWWAMCPLALFDLPELAVFLQS